MLNKEVLLLNLRLKFCNTIQLIGRFSMEIVQLRSPSNRRLLKSTHTTMDSLGIASNRLRKRSNETVDLPQTTIEESVSSSQSVKLSLNNGRERIGQKAWNQLGRSFHGCGMQPMILDASLRSSQNHESTSIQSFTTYIMINRRRILTHSVKTNSEGRSLERKDELETQRHRKSKITHTGEVIGSVNRAKTEIVVLQQLP